MSNIHFETQRLIVRHATAADLDDLFALFNDAEVLRYNCITDTTRERIAQNLEKGQYKYVIQFKENGKVIGTIGKEEDSLRYGVNSICISYELKTEYTRKGYMYEALSAFLEYAFNTLKVDIVTARVFSANTASLCLLQKLGFTQEGCLKHAIHAPSGIIYDDCLFALFGEKHTTTKKQVKRRTQ